MCCCRIELGDHIVGIGSFRCIVLSDCCASYFPEFHDMGLKMIKAQGGIFGSVSASAPVIAALSGLSSVTKAFAAR